MTLTLEVLEVAPGSFQSKKGETIQTLDLICADKSEGRRLKQAVTFGVDRTQKEALAGVDLRDKKIVVEVDEIRTGFQGQTIFSGFVRDVDKLTNGPLKVEKKAS